MRTISSALQTQLDSGYLHTAHLIKLTLTNSASNSDEVIYMTDYHIPLIHLGQTYTALGHFLGFDGLKEGRDLEIETLKLSLSGIDGTKISEVLNYDYVDREIEIYRVFLSDTDTVIGNVHKLLIGRIESPTIVDNPNEGKCIVSIKASSYLSDFDRKTGRHTNNTEQKKYSPDFDDKIFVNWGQINREIVWGYSGD